MSDRPDRLVGIALVLLSGVCFGTLAIFARAAYDAGGEPVSVLFLRFVVAGAAMAALMVLRRERWPRGRNLVALLALGGIGYVGQSLAFFTALTLASAALVSLLLYLFPAIVTLLSAVFLGERITRIRAAALALALAGSALTIGQAGGGRPLGIVLGVLAALVYSVYIVTGSRVTPRAGAIPSTTVILLTATVVYGVVVLFQRPSYPAGWDGALAILGLALVATVVAVVAFFAGLQRIGPSETSSLSTVEPVVTVVLAATLLGETIAPVQLAGGACSLAAVVILARSRPALA